MNKEQRRDNIERAAREHWLNDDEVIKFFQKFVSKTPQELRDVLDDPAFNAGFVAGLAYLRERLPGGEVKHGDIAIISKVLEAVIENTKHTPFVANN